MELSSQQIGELKRRLLVHEALRWVNFAEQGGDNQGQIVEMFQKAVDGKAYGEAWCMAFVQYCIQQVDLAGDVICNATLRDRSRIHESEWCMGVWRKSHPMCHSFDPLVGSVMVWQKGSTSAGHCGIVATVEKGGNHVWTIEGNTGPTEFVTREGDGVYLKKRSVDGAGNMIVKGWLNPWPEVA